MSNSLTQAQIELLKALSTTLEGKTISKIDGDVGRGDCGTNKCAEDVVIEAIKQSVLPLICSDERALHYVANNVKLMWEQQRLEKVLSGVPYVILKGASASIYYPEPLKRMLGDIDIIVKPEYFTMAINALLKAGYVTKDNTSGNKRHIHFTNNGILIELHRRFATLQTRKQEELLDGWIYSSDIVNGGFGHYSFPMLPDQLNGLTILSHINQHLEEGLGLRQIIDWVMYVKHSLPDESWPEFKQLSDQLGLTKLAKVIARLGQIYLGLNMELTWCHEVNESTVEELILYVFECGDFGYGDLGRKTAIMVINHGRGFRGFWSNLQRQGLVNWKITNKHKVLRPFAWIYQLCRYTKYGIRQVGIKNIRSIIVSSRRRKRLLDDLEVTRYALREE